MDPLKIAVRALAAFLFLLALLRLSGKRTIYQGTAFDFVLALVLGDMVDKVVCRMRSPIDPVRRWRAGTLVMTQAGA